MARCVLVIGTPRSGTSLCAGVLHSLGVSMGSRFAPPTEMNPRGSWVDLDFDEPLRDIDNSRKWPPILTDLHREAYRSLIQQRNASHAVWGVKNLWTGMTWQWFAEQADVLVLRTSRNQAVSQQSLATWTRHSPEFIATLVGHFKSLANRVHGVPILDVDYDSLIDDTRNTVGAIANFVGLPVNPAAVELIDPTLRRAG